MGLNVRGGDVDISEAVDLHGVGDDGRGLVGAGARWWVSSPGFAKSSGKTSQTVSHSFSISAVMCFWSAWKGEVVNVVEVLTYKFVEVWESLRLDSYSNEVIVHFGNGYLGLVGEGGMK